jgi:hypothetical protein
MSGQAHGLHLQAIGELFQMGDAVHLVPKVGAEKKLCDAVDDAGAKSDLGGGFHVFLIDRCKGPEHCTNRSFRSGPRIAPCGPDPWYRTGMRTGDPMCFPFRMPVQVGVRS